MTSFIISSGQFLPPPKKLGAKTPHLMCKKFPNEGTTFEANKTSWGKDQKISLGILCFSSFVNCTDWLSRKEYTFAQYLFPSHFQLW